MGTYFFMKLNIEYYESLAKQIHFLLSESVVELTEAELQTMDEVLSDFKCCTDMLGKSLVIYTIDRPLYIEISKKKVIIRVDTRLYRFGKVTTMPTIEEFIKGNCDFTFWYG